MSNRRTFIKQLLFTIPIATWGTGLLVPNLRNLRFGWVTDIHYAKAIPKWNRHFEQSIIKLNEAITVFNGEHVDFAIETGDFKDQTEPPVASETIQYLKDIEACFAEFKGPRYHVLGNHDLDSISKKQFLENVVNTNIPINKSYYWFEINGWRLVVLDACFTKDGTPYNNGNFKWYNTKIPKKQLIWLKDTLESPLPTLVFTHQLLDGKGNLYIKNASKVRKILEQSNNVKAVFQGHKHEGGYSKLNGIHYITQKALVEGDGPDNNCYSVVEVTTNNIHIYGFRRADNHQLML